jgi:hypothetical protein
MGNYDQQSPNELKDTLHVLLHCIRATEVAGEDRQTFREEFDQAAQTLIDKAGITALTQLIR